MNLLDRVKELITLRGMTIAELERKANLSNGSIRRWENSFPSADKLQKVAKILGTSMDYLLLGKSAEDNETVLLARGMSTLTPEQLETVKFIIEQFNKTNGIK